VTVLDSIEVWLVSLQASLELAGVEVRAQRAPADRPVPSWAINLRRGVREADLVVWESGLGELGLVSGAGSAALMEHHSDLQKTDRLGKVLARMLEAVAFVESSKQSQG